MSSKKKTFKSSPAAVFQVKAPPIDLTACAATCKPVLQPTPVEGKNRILTRWIRGPTGEPYFGDRKIFLPGFSRQQFIYKFGDCIFILNFVEPGYPAFTILSVYCDDTKIISAFNTKWPIPIPTDNDNYSQYAVYQELAKNVLESAECNTECSTDVEQEMQRQKQLITEAKKKPNGFSFFLQSDAIVGPIRNIDQIIDKHGNIIAANINQLFLIEPLPEGGKKNKEKTKTKKQRKTKRPNKTKRRKSIKTKRRKTQIKKIKPAASAHQYY